MGFVVKYDMILDMLCAFDTLTGDAFCVQYHEAVYERFGRVLGASGYEALDVLKSELGETKIGQALIGMLIKTKDFQFKTMRECFEQDGITQREQRIIDAAVSLSEVLIEQGFHTYWLEEVLPGLEARAGLLGDCWNSAGGIWHYRDALDQQDNPPKILWLCGCSRPYRFQVTDDQYVGDPGVVDAYLTGNKAALFPSEYASFENFLNEITWEQLGENLLCEA